MKNQVPQNVEDAYDYLSEIYTSCLGNFPDITAAFYNGNFSKSFHDAQKDKHDWILHGIGLEAGNRILDVGCGWGNMLNAIRQKAGHGLGLTVSEKQKTYCVNRGLNAILRDWKNVEAGEYGKFEGIISVGAFEHFCSTQEYGYGMQEEIYQNFFKFCSENLVPKGKLFLQTMLWGGRVPVYPDEFDLSAQRDSEERILGNLFALSSWWPPVSKEQVVKCAEQHFEFLDSVNGREDYARTFWDFKRIYDAGFSGKIKIQMKIFGRKVTDKKFRKIFGCIEEVLKRQYFREAFINKILDHERMFFKRK